MYQKDFILRMLEMLGEFIAGILGLIRKGDFPEATIALDNAYYDYLKMDAAFFKRIPEGELVEKLLDNHNFTNGHLEVLANLFYAEAELLYTCQKREEAIGFYRKSRVLFQYTVKKSKAFSIGNESIVSNIEDKLHELELKNN